MEKIDTILVNDIEIYAYHGLNETERIVGQWYVVDVEVSGDFSAAVENDDISGTVDYGVVNKIVHYQMTISSKLIEHVAGRIAKNIQKQFPIIKKGRITITKKQPPIHARPDSVRFSLSW